MENIKKKFNKFIKYLKFLIKKTLLKHPNKTKNIFNKIKFKIELKSGVSDFNIYLISLISILFIYLFYLTIPNIYDKSWVQNTVEKKLFNEFKIDRHEAIINLNQEKIDKIIYFNPGESAGSIVGKSALGIVNLNSLEIRRIFF